VTTSPFPEFDPEMTALLERCLPRLQRWATGRMPNAIRSMNDTGDIVQDAVISSLRQLDRTQITTDGALLAYLRTAVKNRIIDQHRRHKRRPVRIEIPIDVPADETSPVDTLIGVEAMDRYELAVNSLGEKDRQLVLLHVEFGMTHPELAEAMQLNTPNAARSAVIRALGRLSTAMGR
jgi:RNA polymerase sigma factor (sigma-70 family)